MAGYHINIFLSCKGMCLQDYKIFNQMFMNEKHLYVLESKIVDKGNQEYLLNYAKWWRKR